VEFLQGRRVSQRRACVLAGIHRSVHRYRCVRRGQGEDLRVLLDEIAREFPSAGYRMAWSQCRRRGMAVNHKRVHRVWREQGLMQPRRVKRKRHPGGSVPLQARFVNHVWTYDFMADSTLQGRTLRVLTLKDEYTREGLAVEVEFQMPSSKVMTVLDRVFGERGAPQYLRSDNGPEFIAQELIAWLYQRGVKTHHIDPGSPWQNAFGESFNATLRRELFHREVFHNLEEARVKAASYRRLYNERRGQSSLGYLTPVEFRQGVRIPLLASGLPSSSSPPPPRTRYGDEDEDEGRKKKREEWIAAQGPRSSSEGVQSSTFEWT